MADFDFSAFDYTAYCAEMEARIAAGERLVKAGDGFYYYHVPAAIEDTDGPSPHD